jgi:type IV pilus assembly protein PilQ
MIRAIFAAVALPALLGAGALHAEPPLDGRVTGLRLDGSSGQTALTIQVLGGTVRWSDFALDGPPRVVVDISGARSELPGDRFEGINRGGISSVRSSQYQNDVVRVVIDLQRSSHYAITRVPEGIRVSFGGEGPTTFDPWHSGLARASGARAQQVQQAQPRPPARRITVTFQDEDIREVLASFAEFTGRTIIPGAGVTGRVSAVITDQPWDVALQSLLSAHGLAVVEQESGIIRVDALERLRAREEQDPLVTQTFRVNYVPVAELVQTLTPLRTARGSITSSPSTNTLIITDVEGAVNNIAAMVRQLDIRTPQVAISARIVFVTRSALQDVGITYDLRDTRQADNLGPVSGIVALSGRAILALGSATQVMTDPTLDFLGTLLLGNRSLNAFLQALQERQLTEVESAPVITTSDNHEAEVWVGSRTPIRVVDAGAPGAAARATAEMVETGTRLTVTPHVTADRRVLMQIQAERSFATAAPGEFGVAFDIQRGTTRLMVMDGETAVIGGMTETQVVTTRRGVPILMDIPYVGALFRRSTQSEIKRDLLIMVTPHIVEENF